MTNPFVYININLLRECVTGIEETPNNSRALNKLVHSGLVTPYTIERECENGMIELVPYVKCTSLGRGISRL